MNTQLDTAIERYTAALEGLEQTDDGNEVDRVLRILNARDAVQVALKAQMPVPITPMQQIVALDEILRQNIDRITHTVKPEMWGKWRESVQPTAEAWWWKLESLASPHPWDSWDCLWKGLTFVSWTANLSLLVNIATRFFSGGVGLGGATAVIVPSLLALLQASSEVTKSGQEGFDKLLDMLKIPRQYREEAKLGSTLLLSGLLVGLWLALPSISVLYNRSGLQNQEEGKFGAAEQDFLKAIALDADNAEAHYNLGFLYEEWQDLERAKKEYQVALGGDLPEAYNNLGRLYLLEKKYDRAAAIFATGLDLAKEQKSYPDEQYSLLKNLGWVRLQQGWYVEAQKHLQDAIEISSNPEVEPHIFSLGASHCLLAQVLEKQKQPTALEQWQQCCQLGDSLNPDENTWLPMAADKLRKAGKQCEIADK
jgi:tetratricopeptide (TPR) repeat protein